MAKINRVLIVVTQSEYGGAQRFLFNLLSRLDRSHYELLLVTGANENNDFLVEQVRQMGVAVKPLRQLQRKLSLWHDWRAVLALKKIIQEFRPDTIFLNSSKAGFVGALAAQLTRSSVPAKVIYRIGGWTFNDPWPNWKKILFIMLEKISAGWKDSIIVNNQADLVQAQRLKIRPRQEILLVPNGLDVYRTNFLAKTEARQQLKVSQFKTVIGTIANFYPAKGLTDLLAVAEHFKDRPELVFVIIGDGPLRQDLESEIKKLKLEEKIILAGQLPDAYQYLPAFDILVLPSVKEGFPWTILEALAAKVPIIATTVGAVPEIIENGKNGLLVAPGNPSALAQALTTLLADELYRQELALHGHQTVLLKYDLEKMVRSIEALL